jgi:hypothetical protein
MIDEDDYNKYDDDVIEYHIKSTPDQCSITLTVVAATPISQAQYEMILLSFVDDIRKGKSGDNAEWLLDEDIKNMQ